jgi:riboflavin transporter
VKYVILWVRIAFAIHCLVSGLNYWLHFVPPPAIHISPILPYINEMTRVGLYDLIKIVEVAVGFCLLCNFAVPLALLVEFPLTVSIFYLNMFVDGEPRQVYTALKELFFNGFLLLAYFGYYRDMLRLHGGPRPFWQPTGAR